MVCYWLQNSGGSRDRQVWYQVELCPGDRDKVLSWWVSKLGDILGWIIYILLDINDRMPREEAKEIFDLIKPIGKF